MTLHLLSPRTLLQQIAPTIKPPKRLKVSEWADEFAMIPRGNAEPGRWRTDRAPYQRGMMDVVNEPGVKGAVYMTSAQIGKTSILLNINAYFMDLDPCPQMCVLPTLEMAEDHSKRRLAPILRETPKLKGLVKDPHARDSGNTLLDKEYPGGRIILSGANSPSSLAARSIRVGQGDEIDRWPRNAGTEGDPWLLFLKRLTSFWNAVWLATSTPTIKGASRIEKLWEQSDQRLYLVPCPHCDKQQFFAWERFDYPGKGTPQAQPDKAVYLCVDCETPITDGHKPQMLLRGHWVAQKPFKGIAGFHLNEFYSPWRKFADVALDHEAARLDPLQLQVWQNTSLGLPYEIQEGEPLEWERLRDRANEPPEGTSPYSPRTLPAWVRFLTAGVDVQQDRLECSVWGWGRGEECGLIDHVILAGDPKQDEVWSRLDDIVLTSYPHETGASFSPRATCVDSGYLTQEVYQQVRRRARWFPTKGDSSNTGKPIVGRPSQQEINYKGEKVKRGIKIYIVGTDQAKATLHGRAKLATCGPKYIHFPAGMDDAYFEGFCAEVQVKKHRNGVAYYTWEKVNNARNEPLDCAVLALAAAHLCGLVRMRWAREDKALVERVKAQNVALDDTTDLTESPPLPPDLPPKKPPRTRINPTTGRPRGGWMGGVR